MSNEGFLRLFEAVMAQAYVDAKSSNEKLASEAQGYIDSMKKNFGN